MHLAAPARRIVSLAPHATELLFAAGAGAQVVGAVRYSDFPEAARRIPVVGDAQMLDLERIAALQPDLIVVWLHGTPASHIERLASLKRPIYRSDPGTLAGIAQGMRALGHLAGTDAVALPEASRWEAELSALRQRYSGRAPLRVFYQIWHQPLMSINDQHLISDAIRLCGGVNVMGSQRTRVPAVSLEAVLAARPQVLVSSQSDEFTVDPWALWRPFARFEPIANKATLLIPADSISRPGPRMLLATRQLCEGLERIRVPH